MARRRARPFGNGPCRETACLRAKAARVYLYESAVCTSILPHMSERSLDAWDGLMASLLGLYSTQLSLSLDAASGKSCRPDFMLKGGIAKQRGI